MQYQYVPLLRQEERFRKDAKRSAKRLSEEATSYFSRLAKELPEQTLVTARDALRREDTESIDDVLSNLANHLVREDGTPHYLVRSCYAALKQYVAAKKRQSLTN